MCVYSPVGVGLITTRLVQRQNREGVIDNYIQGQDAVIYAIIILHINDKMQIIQQNIYLPTIMLVVLVTAFTDVRGGRGRFNSFENVLYASE
jgi:hypothetical protein